MLTVSSLWKWMFVKMWESKKGGIYVLKTTPGVLQGISNSVLNWSRDPEANLVLKGYQWRNKFGKGPFFFETDPFSLEQWIWFHSVSVILCVS